MKRQTIAIFLAIIIALPVVSILIYTQLTSSESQGEALKNLKITDLSIDYPSVLVWGYVYWRFNVTVQNFGDQSASGITLEVRMLNDETRSMFWNYTTALGTLEAGEKRVIDGNASTNMDAWDAYTATYGVANPRNITSFYASLTLGTLILDERNWAP